MKAILLLLLVWLLGGGVLVLLGFPDEIAAILGLAAPVSLFIWAVKNQNK